MPYTPSEITQLKQLAYHPDLNNVYLAFELLKNRAWDERLATALYWLAFRFGWEQAKQALKEVGQFIQQHNPALAQLDPLLEWVTKSIEAIFKDYYARIEHCKISCEELALALHQFPFSTEEQKVVLPFIFRFGSEEIRQETLPQLIHKKYTGVLSLDLNNQYWQQLPRVIFEAHELQELILDGNKLQHLPDKWAQLPSLEFLHLTNNQLSTLPPSFGQLQCLQRLYLQNNPWDATALKASLTPLKQLQHLQVASTTTSNSSLHHLEALVQKGLLQATDQEQRLFLGLELQDSAALASLSLLELFDGLHHEQSAIRALARQQLLSLSNIPATVKQDDSIAVLGMVSFAAREHLDQLAQSGWTITNEIESSTTHLVLGDYPEQFEAVGERAFIFLSEKEVLALQ